jgi:hypothetical protein
MAKKPVSLKPVVEDIDDAAQALKKIRSSASRADKKKLNLKIKALKGLKAHAARTCHRAGLNLWVPLKP